MTATIEATFEQIVSDAAPTCASPGCDAVATHHTWHQPCGYGFLICTTHAEKARRAIASPQQALMCKECGRRYEKNEITARRRDFPVEELR